MWPIVGLLSSYREGLLSELTVRSMRECCELVLVLEGPAGNAPPDLGEPSLYWRGRQRPQNVLVREGAYASDAAKRTELIRWAQHKMGNSEFWAVIYDGDEELLWAHALPAYLHRAEQEGPEGAMQLKIVEVDGTVVESGARCTPGHAIDHYVLSSYQIVLKSGVLVTLPHLTAKKAPVMGEPHIIHRSYLRAAERRAPEQRLSEVERLEMVKLGVSELAKPGDAELLARLAP